MNKKTTGILLAATMVMLNSFEAYGVETSLCKSELLGANQTLLQGQTLTQQQKSQLQSCLSAANACSNYLGLEYNCQHIRSVINTATVTASSPTTIEKKEPGTPTETPPPPQPVINTPTPQPTQQTTPTNGATNGNGNNTNPPAPAPAQTVNFW